MADFADLKAAFDKYHGGAPTREDQRCLRSAISQAALVLGGSRNMAIDGDDDANTFVTGDNVVVAQCQTSDEATREFEGLFPKQLRELPSDLSDFTDRSVDLHALVPLPSGDRTPAMISAIGTTESTCDGTRRLLAVKRFVSL